MMTQFGQFVPDNTFIHRLDPRTKIITLTIFMTSIFIWADYRLFIAMTMLLAIIITLSRIKFKNILNGIKPLVWMFVFLMIINIFVIKQGPILFTIPLFNRPVYLKAITQAIFIFWRVVMIVVMSIVLTSTTNPLTLTLGLEKLFKPLKLFKVPVEIFAMMLAISLRFIPTIFEEVGQITNAQASRGLDFQNGRLKEKIKALVALIIPLLVSSFNKATDLALSMESKNYNPDATRPRYRNIYLTSTDWAVIIFMVIYLLVIIYIRRIL